MKTPSRTTQIAVAVVTVALALGIVWSASVAGAARNDSRAYIHSNNLPSTGVALDSVV